MGGESAQADMAAPRRWTLELYGLPPLQAAGSRGHWARRHRIASKWKHDVWASVLAAGKPSEPLWRAHIECIRYGIRTPDHDNLVASFKSCIDGLKGVLIVDDSPDYLSVTYRFVRVYKLKAQRIELVVTEVIS